MAILRNQINREAKGFLSLFRAKVGGQGPITLREDVQPVIDVQSFLSAGALRGAVVSNTGNPPANANISVTKGEYWMIHRIALTIWSGVGFTAGTIAMFALQIQGLPDDAGALTDLQLGLCNADNSASQTAGGGQETVYVPSKDLILPPGVNIQGQYLFDDSAQNYDINLSVLYTPLVA